MFLLPIVALAIWWIPFGFETTQTVSFNAPLWNPLIDLLPEVEWLRTLLAFVLIIVAAILLNRTLIKFEFYPETSYLSCLVFVVVSSIYEFQLSFHPLLFANIFLILTLRQLLGIYRTESAVRTIFNAGFFLSISLMFFTPLVVVTPILFIALFIVRPFVWREWLLGIIGLGVPQLFVWVGYYATNTILPKLNFGLNTELINRAMVGENNVVGLVLWGAVLLLSALSFVQFVKVRMRATNRKRRIMLIIGWVSLLTYGSYLLSCMSDELTTRFSVMALPLTLFFSYPLMTSKSKIIPHLLFYTLLVASGVNYYLHFTGS